MKQILKAKKDCAFCRGSGYAVHLVTGRQACNCFMREFEIRDCNDVVLDTKNWYKVTE